jgi:hypothetical protein
VVLLLGVPVLAVSMALARAGSARAVLYWLGAAAFVLYDSVVLVFFTPFHRLFLLDVAMLGLAAWSVGTVLWQTDVAGLGRRFTETVPVRGVAVYVWVIVAANTVLAEQDRAPADQRPAGGVPARDRPAHQRGVRAGPGAVAAADRGGRGMAVAAPPLGAIWSSARPWSCGSWKAPPSRWTSGSGMRPTRPRRKRPRRSRRSSGRSR